MSSRSENSAFQLYQQRSVDYEDATNVPSSPPPLPKSPVERFDPYSDHHLASPSCYDPHQQRRKMVLPHDLSLETVFDGGLQKMVIDLPQDLFMSPLAAKQRQRPRIMLRGGSKSKVGQKMKETAGVV